MKRKDGIGALALIRVLSGVRIRALRQRI